MYPRNFRRTFNGVDRSADDAKSTGKGSAEDRPRVRGVAAGIAVARCRGVSAYGHSLVRRSAQIHSRARNRHGIRQADHAGFAEERVRRRSQYRRHSHGRNDCQYFAAAEIAGRHRESAGRGRAPRRYSSVPRNRGTVQRAYRGARVGADYRSRRRGVDALRAYRVRSIRQAEHEDPAGDPDVARRDRRPQPFGRYHRGASFT